MTLSDADLGLLRRFEPILRFTHGELFFPMATGPFVESCDLLEGPTLREANVVVPTGALNLDRLGAVADPPPGHSQYLRFVPKPMNAVELTRWRGRADAPHFDAPGRLARVGLAARLVDAGLVTSLLLRGRVPGGTAAAASVRYDEIRARDPRMVYHARVRRDGPWIVLHYLFFYAMNDWRSTFDGANDHESDWEQCFVVLEAMANGDVQPAWFCAAAHDEKGDDLRRRWDDPRLERSGEHPVVYPGAGSHATYLERGEYIMSLPFPGEQNLHGPLDMLRHFWRDTLSQPDPGDLAGKVRRTLSVPFVDYARGDGVNVGPGTDHEWVAIGIGDDDGWVDGYRGLWGLDTGDRFAGERAPAGPKYTRTGSVRQAWYDPLGFAGLGKVAPPSTRVPALQSRIAELTLERDATVVEAQALANTLPAIEQEVAALRETSGLERYAVVRAAELAAGEARLGALRLQAVETAGAIAAARRRVAELEAGRMEDPRAHLRHAAQPEPPAVAARRAYGETWAALSVGLLIAALAVIVYFRILPPALAVVVLFGAYLALEAFFSRRFLGLILRISVFFAIVTAIILAVTFARELVLAGLLLLGLLLIGDNIAEIRRRRSS
jgi:hypothetical protein